MENYTKSDAYSDSLLNSFTLFFSKKEFEKKYRSDYYDKSIRSFRISFLLITFIYAAFGVVDLQTSQAYIHQFFIVRYGIVVPVLLLTYLSTYIKSLKKYWQLFISICYVVGGSGIAYMLLSNPDNMYYYGGMFLIFIAGYFFIKLHYLYSATSGLIVILFFNVAPFISTSLQYSLYSQTISNIFFIVANIISIAAVYNKQRSERQEYFQHLVLKEQQIQIEKHNADLEEKIAKRTELLKQKNTLLKKEIKAREKIQEELVKAVQKAEESDRLKSAFLTNMSHEIRTPMNGIIGFLDIISDPQVSAKERYQFLDLVKQSGNRLLRTINDIVEISKIEAGETVMNFSETNLNEMFSYIGKLYAIDQNKKHIQFTVQELPDIFTIRTDSNKLESILTNLINNAFKFTNSGTIELKVDRQDDKLLFQVADSGCGIPLDKQVAIFNRFIQADQGTTRSYEGTGLGLSIAKAYVESLGGEIWVKSEPHKGSTFYFTIDFEPVNSNSEQIVSTVNFQQKNSDRELTILVAEDDDASFKLLETILQNQNLLLIRAKNGEQAVNQFINNQHKIALILMDIKMPVMDGLTATKKIREIDKDLPIIAQTAFAMSSDKELALQAGCSHYISKPIKRQDLINIINLSIAS